MIADPLTLPCGLRLRNRIAKAAMSEQLADAAGDPTAALVSLYRRWSESGAGLLVTGNAAVVRTAPIEAFNVVVDERSDRLALARWAAAGSAQGSPVLLQLNHPGRQVLRRVARSAVAPSRYRRRGIQLAFAPAAELSPASITGIIDAFARAATIAEEVGFAGVEIHAAHGYLLSQFLSPLTNRRTDSWGGTMEGRMRCLIEVVRAVRAAVSPTFAVATKLNVSDFEAGGFDHRDAERVIHALNDEAIDLVELTGGSAARWIEIYNGSGDAATSYFGDDARRLRRASTLPVMLTGGIRDRATIDALLDAGIDVIGLARPLAVDPAFAGGLLAGDSRGPIATPRRSAVRAIGAALHSPWYQQQIHRLAHGEPADPGQSRVATAYRQAALLRRWARTDTRRRKGSGAASMP